MRDNAWTNWHECPMITSEAAVATNELRPLEHRHLDRRRPMSRYGHYTDSTHVDNPEHLENDAEVFFWGGDV